MRKKQTTFYAGLFVIATIACFDVSAMDKQKWPHKQSIIWTICGILSKHQNKPSLHTHRCIHGKSKKTSDFFEAHQEHIRLQKMLVKARESDCSNCIKELEQQKEKAFKIEKELWEEAEERKYRRLEQSR